MNSPIEEEPDNGMYEDDIHADPRDPSKEDREPKFRIPPPMPDEYPPVPCGYQYYGLGPLKHQSNEQTTDIKNLHTNHDEWTSDTTALFGALPRPVCLRCGSHIWHRNMFTDLLPDKL